MSHKLAHDLLCWIEENASPFALKPSPLAEEPKEEIHSFAESNFKVAPPLTPILCLDVHPFLKKVCDALTKSVATTTLISRTEIETRGWEALFADPFFQYLLLPLDEILSTPLLHSRLPNPVVHAPCASLFPLWKIETYLNDDKKKRDLWESLKRMPLSS